MSATGFFGHTGQTIPGGRMRLPIGQGTPMIGLGSAHGIILASDGSLWSWGENISGFPVLGLGNTKTQVSLCRIGNENDWSSIAVGDQHSLAIKSDGTLWGWGANIYGQLADGTSGGNIQSVPVPSAPGNDWNQVAVGGSHSVALKKDGTLWAWGDNWAGQLGIGSADKEVPEAVQVGSATNWVKVWAGILETVAMQSDGTLWFWGDNPNPAIPQTGAGAANIFSPTRISADTNWVDVGFGPYTVLALKSDGTLWAWGRQAHVFTGARDKTLNTTPTRVGTDNDWQAISPHGWFYELLLKKDGSFWGMQYTQASWDGPGSVRVKRIDLNKNFAAFSAGAGRYPIGVVLTRDGEVWTWGTVLGEHTPAHSSLQSLAKLARGLRLKVHWGNSKPVMRERPWLLPNLDSE
jgi:alpha-tubulin suppressor-like RCC1 family protein